MATTECRCWMLQLNSLLILYNFYRAALMCVLNDDDDDVDDDDDDDDDDYDYDYDYYY